MLPTPRRHIDLATAALLQEPYDITYGESSTAGNRRLPARQDHLVASTHLQATPDTGSLHNTLLVKALSADKHG